MDRYEKASLLDFMATVVWPSRTVAVVDAPAGQTDFNVLGTWDMATDLPLAWVNGVRLTGLTWLTASRVRLPSTAPMSSQVIILVSPGVGTGYLPRSGLAAMLGNLDMAGGLISNLQAAVSGHQAVRLDQVLALIAQQVGANYVLKAGSQMEGALLLPAASALTNAAAAVRRDMVALLNGSVAERTFLAKAFAPSTADADEATSLTTKDYVDANVIALRTAQLITTNQTINFAKRTAVRLLVVGAGGGGGGGGAGNGQGMGGGGAGGGGGSVLVDVVMEAGEAIVITPGVGGFGGVPVWNTYATSGNAGTHSVVSLGSFATIIGNGGGGGTGGMRDAIKGTGGIGGANSIATTRPMSILAKSSGGPGGAGGSGYDNPAPPGGIVQPIAGSPAPVGVSALPGAAGVNGTSGEYGGGGGGGGACLEPVALSGLVLGGGAGGNGKNNHNSGGSAGGNGLLGCGGGGGGGADDDTTGFNGGTGGSGFVVLIK